MLIFPRILFLILVGGSRIGTSKILPILDLLTGTLTSLDHEFILAHMSDNSNRHIGHFERFFCDVNHNVKG